MGRSFDEFLRYLFLFIALICLSLINAAQPGDTDDRTFAGHLVDTHHGFVHVSRNFR